jgi:prepilin-type N-terminal cleavage/methylation domain-containing protein
MKLKFSGPLRHRRLLALSMIEMMVVIAIIAILMSLLLPVFAGAIKKAKNVGRPMDPNNPDSPRAGPSSVPHESNFDE